MAVIPGTSDRNKNLHNCSECESTFTQKSDLNRHMLSVHSTSNVGEKYECNICKKEFKRKDKLMRHKEIHAKARIKIICEVCRDQFNTKDDLRAHRISVHENKQ